MSVAEGMQKTAVAGNVTLVPICDPGDPLCFVYSRGLHNEDLPELFAIDIPIDMMDKIMRLMGMLIGNCRIPGKVFDGYKVEAENVWMETLDVTDEAQHRNIIRSMGLVNISARIRMVKPLWDTWETMPAPTIRQERILGKWRQYREDHPPRSRHEPKSALLERALLDDSEWQLYLTPKQIKHVNENRDYMVKMGLTELCFPDMDKAEAFLQDVSENIHLAPQRYRRGIKVAQGNYTWDI